MSATSLSSTSTSRWLILWVLCAPFLTLGVLSLPLAWIWPTLSVQTPLFLALSIGLTEVVLAAWALWGTRRIQQRHWTVVPKQTLSLSRATGYGIGLGVLLNASLLSLSTLLLFTVPTIAHTLWRGNTAVLAPMLTHATTPWLLVFGLQIVLISPIVEEWFFRGVLWTFWRSRGSAFQASLFTALVFAAYHMTWHAFVPLALVGLVLGILRERYGLRLTWGVHAGFNALTFGLLLWHP